MMGCIGVLAGGFLSGCVAAVAVTEVYAGMQLAGLAGASVAVASGATPIRREDRPDFRVSIEPVGVARTLIACRETMAKFQLTEIRYETNQRETLVMGRSTNAATLGEIATFHLRQRSAEKTLLVIETPHHRKGLEPKALSRSVRQSTEVRTGAPTPKAG